MNDLARQQPTTEHPFSDHAMFQHPSVFLTVGMIWPIVEPVQVFAIRPQPTFWPLMTTCGRTVLVGDAIRGTTWESASTSFAVNGCRMNPMAFRIVTCPARATTQSPPRLFGFAAIDADPILHDDILLQIADSQKDEHHA